MVSHVFSPRRLATAGTSPHRRSPFGHSQGRLDHNGSALEDLASLNAPRFPSARLTGRIWELRNNLRPYDAAYVALAESLELPLLITDARTALAPGHDARVIIARG